MRYLLDTHTFLWWISDDPHLSLTARDIIGNVGNQILFSAASAWEIAIKAQLGRLEFLTDPVTLIPQQLEANAFVELPIDTRHALQGYHLPPHHRDPFDRILVAQAQVEQIPLLTTDRLITQYDVRSVW